MTTLLADIGGTNARFALLDGAAYSPPVQAALAGFTGIAAAIAAYLGEPAAAERRDARRRRPGASTTASP